MKLLCQQGYVPPGTAEWAGKQIQKFRRTGISTVQNLAGQTPITVRSPTVADAPVLRELIEESGVLETNSCYAYLLFCRDFSKTCVVAEADGKPIGVIIGYRPPERRDVVFVWQIGVAKSARRQGIAQRMLFKLIARLAVSGVRYVEATVTPSNTASRNLFESFANLIGAEFRYLEGFCSDDFGNHSHQDEPLIRIGKLPQLVPANVSLNPDEIQL